MGQHRIQRQILRNFSLEGSQPNSRQTWYLSTDSFQPSSRSVNRVGFFDVDCSQDVDQYITAGEDAFKDTLRRFSGGKFMRVDVGREMYDFIAMHYVRSQACSRQIEHMVRKCWEYSMLTQPQAESEYRRLTSNQDVRIFNDLVDSVSRVLTGYTVYPVEITGPWPFVTSNKIMSASLVEAEERLTAVWFPISPSTGLYLESEGHSGQILGPTRIHRQLGRIEFLKIPESQWLRFQEPSPQEGSAEFVNALNGMMVHGSTELFAPDRASIDLALRSSETPTGYRYQPNLDSLPD